MIMHDERVSRDLQQRPPMGVSADLVISFRGRRVPWLEHTFALLILPIMRWRIRRGLRRTRGPAA